MTRTSRIWRATITALLILNTAVYTIGHHAGLTIGETTLYGPFAGLATLGVVLATLTGASAFVATLNTIFQWVEKPDN